MLYHAEWSEKESQDFVHNFQKIMIMKELQNIFGEIYLEGKKTISTDMFFILENITTNCHMDASELASCFIFSINETRGLLQYFYWRKGTYECIEMPCEHFCLKNNEIKDYWTHV